MDQDVSSEALIILTSIVSGAFDIVCELIPHISIILYRVYPDSHLFLSRVFLVACISTFFGTICETAVIFYLFGSLWSQWQLAFKIVTPLLHCAFSATQVHGSRILYQMWKKQRKLMAEKDSREVFGTEDIIKRNSVTADTEKSEGITVTEVQAASAV